MDSPLAQKANGNLRTIKDPRDLRPDAACKRLRECQDQHNACEAIREIVSNLLGCEEMALFQFDREQKRLSLIWSFGIELKAVHLPEMFRGSAFSGVIAGEAYIDHASGDAELVGHGEKASAFVPIRFQGKTAGVLVLLRLLPQKMRIDELDRGLLAVVSREAGKPLFGGKASGPARGARNR
jgi:GAF domain-containing protein